MPDLTSNAGCFGKEGRPKEVICLACPHSLKVSRIASNGSAKVKLLTKGPASGCLVRKQKKERRCLNLIVTLSM